MIRNISSIDMFGISGFSPALCGMVECMYKRITVPILSRYFVEENMHIFPEYYKQELNNMMLLNMYRDYYERILMVSETQVDAKSNDKKIDNFIIDSYPVITLDLKREAKQGEKKLIITYGDFKYYLMREDEGASIEEITPPADLKEKIFFNLDYRREKKQDGQIVSEPIIIKILATTAWNKHPITKFEHIAPFDTNLHSSSVIYNSQENELMYRTRPPFMMYKTPITLKDEKIIECKYLPPGIKDIIRKENGYPCTSEIKVQNFYQDKKKIISLVLYVVKLCIKLCITNTASIIEGTKYKDGDDLSEDYTSFIRFLCLHKNLVTDNIYNLPWDSIVTEEHKNIAVKDLEEMFDYIARISE